MQSNSGFTIIGHACRMPARNIDAFWQLHDDNRRGVTWITSGRFMTQSYHHPSIGQKGRCHNSAAYVGLSQAPMLSPTALPCPF